MTFRFDERHPDGGLGFCPVTEQASRGYAAGTEAVYSVAQAWMIRSSRWARSP